jgi:hypothetical protein
VQPNGESLAPAAHTNDGFFKAVFSQSEHAIAFFKSHLAPAIVARIDWSSLAVLPGSFVKSSLQQMRSDLLFSVRIGGQNKGLWIGKIQAFEEFLNGPVTSDDTLEAMALAALVARHEELHREYETRFKRK